ncbi:hypothetical protein ACC771_20045, partial [Rhizobium ruizarguesonis]
MPLRRRDKEEGSTMSGIVEQKEREDEDRDYKAFLQQLVDGEDVKDAAAGITKKVIAEGEES